jgi:hypothetical protein
MWTRRARRSSSPCPRGSSSSGGARDAPERPRRLPTRGTAAPRWWKTIDAFQLRSSAPGSGTRRAAPPDRITADDVRRHGDVKTARAITRTRSGDRPGGRAADLGARAARVDRSGTDHARGFRGQVTVEPSGPVDGARTSGSSASWSTPGWSGRQPTDGSSRFELAHDGWSSRSTRTTPPARAESELHTTPRHPLGQGRSFGSPPDPRRRTGRGGTMGRRRNPRLDRRSSGIIGRLPRCTAPRPHASGNGRGEAFARPEGGARPPAFPPYLTPLERPAVTSTLAVSRRGRGGGPRKQHHEAERYSALLSVERGQTYCNQGEVAPAAQPGAPASGRFHPRIRSPAGDTRRYLRMATFTSMSCGYDSRIRLGLGRGLQLRRPTV